MTGLKGLSDAAEYCFFIVFGEFFVCNVARIPRERWGDRGMRRWGTRGPLWG
jgi:hypothetical protein